MTKVLVVVDMQNDFVDGSLGSEDAQKIVPAVVNEIEDSSYDSIFVTMDTHEENYMHTHEGKYLPVPHCIRETDGWKIFPAVKEALAKRASVVKIVEKPTFGSLTLAEMVRAIQPKEITLVGLCTDICVASNALLLRAAIEQAEIAVVSSACAGVTPAKHQAALDVMQSCQINIR